MKLHAVQAELDALKRLQAETVAELDALLPSILHRAWTHSLPAHSAFGLSHHEILLAPSQLARIKGEL